MVRSPSFRGFKPASQASSRTKRANRRRDTLHEVMLRRKLWQMGLRYRKNVDSLPGKPDIVFSRARLVVFCDGNFWHGRNWTKLRAELQHRANSEYWIAKIESNIERDAKNTALLEQAGWRVIRLWESDIKKDLDSVAAYVRDILYDIQRMGQQQD